LQGHLSIVKELVCFLNSEKKMEFGVTNGLIRDLINDYLFPTSKLMLKLEKTGECLNHYATETFFFVIYLMF
jgi:hypothetical protein